ncbi:hypothetical protein JZU61_05470 [bacterium]|nr:hypothetical protein [bacterium]
MSAFWINFLFIAGAIIFFGGIGYFLLKNGGNSVNDPGLGQAVNATRTSLIEQRMPDSEHLGVYRRKAQREGRVRLFAFLQRMISEGEKSFTLPYLVPGQLTGIIFGSLLLIIVFVVVIFGLSSSMGIPLSNPTVPSGPVPMEEKFEVEPITTYSLDYSVITPYVGQIDAVRRLYQCQSGTKSTFYVVGGTLILDNFTGKNVLVTRPADLPGQVIVECKRGGDLAIFVDPNVAAPVIAQPTDMPTQALPTQAAPTQAVAAESASVEQAAQPAESSPTTQPSGENLFAASVKHAGTYWAGPWNGIGSNYSNTRKSGCGVWESFDESEVIAVVKTSDAVPTVRIKISDDGNSVMVDCSYSLVEYYTNNP